MGAFLLPLTLINRGCSRAPDGLIKAGLEAALYILAAALPLGLIWMAWQLGWDLFRWEGGRPVVPLPLSFFTTLSLTTFALYTVVDIRRHLLGSETVEGVRIRRELIPYHPRKGDPRVFPRRWNGIFDLNLVQVTVEVPGLNPSLEGLRLGHLTDFHLGKECHRNFIRYAIEKLLEASPDLIAITGDFVNFSRYLDECFGALADVHPPLGVYAVRGNHDYWVGGDRIGKRITDLGFTLLDNKTVEVEKEGARILLSGIESRWNKAGTPLDYIPLRDERLEIVLSHTPDEFPRVAKRNPHLVLSGHTHGGQICLPFFGPVVVPSDYGRRYASGVFKRGGSLLYVSRGVGCYPPFRTLCDPEITVFEFV
jgi:hypothetical protein